MRRHWAILLGLFSISAYAAPLSEEQMWAGNLRAATETLVSELKAAPNDVDAHERWIDLLYSLGRPDEALKRYSAFLELHPDNPDAHYLLGRAISDPELGSEAFRNALALKPDHVRAMVGLGDIARGLGKFDEAISEYQRALAIDPRLLSAWLGWAAAERSQGHFEPAQKILKQGLEKHEHVDLLLALVEVAPLSDIPALLDRAIKLEPKDARSRLARAALSLDKGRDPTSDLNIIFSIYPAHGMAGRWQAYVVESKRGHFDLSDWKKFEEIFASEYQRSEAALMAWETMHARYPKSTLPLLGRARANIFLNKFPEAETDLRAAAALQPNDRQIAGALGAFLSANAPAEAVPWLEKAAVDPADPDRILAVITTRARFDKPKALIDAQTGHTRLPKDIPIFLELARLTSETGEREKAYELLKSASFTDERVALALVAAAKDIGKLSEAAKILEDLAVRTGEPSFRRMAEKILQSPP